MDKIIMKNMTFYACHGVLDVEKKHPQPFEIDCILYFDAAAAAQSDRIEDTINYAMGYEIINDIVTENCFNLIERLAGAVAEGLLLGFDRIRSVEVEVRKPKAPIDGEFDYMGVSITRSRDDISKHGKA